MSRLPLARLGLRVLERLAPEAAAAVALHLFFTPTGRRWSRRVDQFLNSGRRFDVVARGERVAAWSFGSGPLIYLVHGWAGLGGQLAEFAAPLLESGFRVVTFDAPGHGRSGGRRSSIVHFAAALRAVVAREGAPHAVIAHSLGAAATARALAQGLTAERVVFLGPTGGPRDWAERFRVQLGLSVATMNRLRRRSERWLAASWDEFDVTWLAQGQTAPLLVLHDRGDAEVPWSDGAAIAQAWPGARLVTTEGLGHRRILRDEGVVRQVADFVRAGVPTPDACEHGIVTRAACATCALEQHLFQRVERTALLLA
jgi:pimeloyl-ACP methyl ester carboxylesterase